MAANADAQTQSGRELWLQCSASGAPSFCTQLKADIERVAKMRVRMGAAPDGAIGVHVNISNIQSRGAKIILSGGRFSSGTLQMQERQDLDVSVSDAQFGAGSALALVHPIVTMLQRIR